MKVILSIYIIISSILFLCTAGIQLAHPEWFIWQVPNKNKVTITFINETETKGTPYRLCDECEWKNLPENEPYVMQTKWRWLYQYQNYIIVALLVLGFAINWEKIVEWKRMYSK